MIEEQDLKQLPYGVSDFKKFRDGNYYYVDKTRYIRDIEKKAGTYFSSAPVASGNRFSWVFWKLTTTSL